MTSNTYQSSRSPKICSGPPYSFLHQIGEERFGKQPSLEEHISLGPSFLDFPRGKYFRGHLLQGLAAPSSAFQRMSDP